MQAYLRKLSSSQAQTKAKPMRYASICLILLTGCTGEANHLGNPLLWPYYGLSTAIGNASYNERRGRVEVQVKTHFDQIITEITAGGGPALTEAMDIAQIPAETRALHIAQLQQDMHIYEASPDALIVALMVFGP